VSPEKNGRVNKVPSCSLPLSSKGDHPQRGQVGGSHIVFSREIDRPPDFGIHLMSIAISSSFKLISILENVLFVFWVFFLVYLLFLFGIFQLSCFQIFDAPVYNPVTFKLQFGKTKMHLLHNNEICAKLL
jgi:hypothetical protein